MRTAAMKKASGYALPSNEMPHLSPDDAVCALTAHEPLGLDRVVHVRSANGGHDALGFLGVSKKLRLPFDGSAEFLQTLDEESFCFCLWKDNGLGLERTASADSGRGQESEPEQPLMTSMDIDGGWTAPARDEPIDDAQPSQNLRHAILQADGL